MIGSRKKKSILKPAPKDNRGRVQELGASFDNKLAARRL